MVQASHPGEVLSQRLSKLGVTPTELARQLGVPPNRISQIIHGKRAITGDTALRLAHWFGNDAAYWMSLQSDLDVQEAARRAGKEIKKLPTFATVKRSIHSVAGHNG